MAGNNKCNDIVVTLLPIYICWWCCCYICYTLYINVCVCVCVCVCVTYCVCGYYYYYYCAYACVAAFTTVDTLHYYTTHWFGLGSRHRTHIFTTRLLVRAPPHTRVAPAALRFRAVRSVAAPPLPRLPARVCAHCTLRTARTHHRCLYRVLVWFTWFPHYTRFTTYTPTPHTAHAHLPHMRARVHHYAPHYVLVAHLQVLVWFTHSWFVGYYTGLVLDSTTHMVCWTLFVLYNLLW